MEWIYIAEAVVIVLSFFFGKKTGHRSERKRNGHSNGVEKKESEK